MQTNLAEKVEAEEITISAVTEVRAHKVISLKDLYIDEAGNICILGKIPSSVKTHEARTLEEIRQGKLQSGNYVNLEGWIYFGSEA